MTMKLFPFASGAGANVSEDDWRAMLGWWQGGYGIVPSAAWDVSGFEVTDAGTSPPSVNVAPGAAWFAGHYGSSDATENVVLGTPDRNYLIVLHADLVTRTMTIKANSGVLIESVPGVTRDNTAREIPLAYVAVSGGVITGILDRRWGMPAMWRWTRSAYTASSTDTDHRVLWDGQDAGMHSVDLPTRSIPVLEAGVYHITARVDFTAAVYVTSHIRIMRGSTEIDASAAAKPNDARYTLHTSTLLERGDTIELHIIPASSADIAYASLLLTRAK